MRRDYLRASENFGNDAMLEFLAGLATSRQEIDAISHLGQTFDPQHIWDVDNMLRVIANLQMSVDAAEIYSKPPSRIDNAIGLLRFEHHFDTSP